MEIVNEIPTSIDRSKLKLLILYGANWSGNTSEESKRWARLMCPGTHTYIREETFIIYGIVKYRDVINPNTPRGSTFGYKVKGTYGTSSTLERLPG